MKLYPVWIRNNNNKSWKPSMVSVPPSEPAKRWFIIQDEVVKKPHHLLLRIKDVWYRAPWTLCSAMWLTLRVITTIHHRTTDKVSRWYSQVPRMEEPPWFTLILLRCHPIWISSRPLFYSIWDWHTNGWPRGRDKAQITPKRLADSTNYRINCCSMR